MKPQRERQYMYNNKIMSYRLQADANRHNTNIIDTDPSAIVFLMNRHRDG